MSGRIRVLYILLMIGTVGVLGTTALRLAEMVTILDVQVHVVSSTGQTVDCWNVFSPHRIRPLAVPTWTPTDYRVGNVRIDVRIRNDAGRIVNLGFDTQTFGRETFRVGERVSTNSQLVQPRAQRVFVHWIRMWAENITQESWIVNSETGEELAHFHFNLDRASKSIQETGTGAARCLRPFLRGPNWKNGTIIYHVIVVTSNLQPVNASE